MSRSTVTMVVSRFVVRVQLLGDRADHVVGLVALHLVDRDPQRLDDLADLRELVAEVVRHLLAGGLVGGELLVPEGRPGQVERDGEVVGLQVGDAPQDDAGEAEDAVDELAAGGRERRKGEVAAVDEPVAVEQHQAFGGHGPSVAADPPAEIRREWFRRVGQPSPRRRAVQRRPNSRRPMTSRAEARTIVVVRVIGPSLVGVERRQVAPIRLARERTRLAPEEQPGHRLRRAPRTGRPMAAGWPQRPPRSRGRRRGGGRSGSGARRGCLGRQRDAPRAARPGGGIANGLLGGHQVRAARRTAGRHEEATGPWPPSSPARPRVVKPTARGRLKTSRDEPIAAEQPSPAADAEALGVGVGEREVARSRSGPPSRGSRRSARRGRRRAARTRGTRRAVPRRAIAPPRRRSGRRDWR